MGEKIKEVTQESVLGALKSVNDPDLKQNIVDLGFVKNLKICGGAVALDIELTTPACPVKELMKAQAEKVVKAIAGVDSVAIQMTARVRKSVSAGQVQGMEKVKNLIAVASGKGGVGKSTVATNLAIALAQTGAKVGLMDADIYGPSAPKLMGSFDKPPISSTANMIVPIERHGIKFISMGLLTNEQTPVIWRGPMATKLVQQFLSQVEWGELDYLIIDLPPGTGDVQLTLTQAAPLTGAVIVTTPQELAVGVTMRGLRMFEQVRVPILGIVENMSGFVCPHCQKTTEIFSIGGGKKAADQIGVNFLGAIPLLPEIAAASDRGEPQPERFSELAKRIAQQVSIVNEATAKAQIRATEVSAQAGAVRIRWSDGKESILRAREIRLNCMCALCVDEHTGARKLKNDNVPQNLELSECNHVGRYALHFKWSDGHSTGIYPYEKLRAMDPTLCSTLPL